MATITNINQLDIANGVYTYADYLLWKFEERVELLKGKIFRMSPAPSVKHQKISINLSGLLWQFFKGKKCQLFSAPFDVRLPKKNEKGDQIHTVVQPDLCVICDENKLDERGCIGAPDLIIEILSPGNSKKEMKNKFELYQESGVEEYWIVNPTDENILVNVLEDGKYRILKPVVDEYITSVKFPELKIHTSDIF
ncbi:restriction endonuclease [Capnocytophaga sp. H4358]|uniref:Uma2 family endonuclease n=1 Tax=Capnocytophaga sp. H4358 TaxID=1945658 RepID=UPI000BB1DCEF|nr:Uma2 family endonuclease [Capnocytophaga sp. H4358]ATA73741.1 restriction endonuclease [Capnocytophaga sp. H4358]ATA73744.1 restriction endonuclease [Capnocytophaga sp. H4358]